MSYLTYTKEVPKAELLFSDEITGSLRTMKNVTSAVKDRAEARGEVSLVTYQKGSVSFLSCLDILFV